MIDKFHNSHFKTYRRCKKQFEYNYIQNIEPKTPNLPLARGIWIHYMLGAQYLRWGIERESLIHTPKYIPIDGVGQAHVDGGSLTLDITTDEGENLAYELSAAGILTLLIEQIWDKLFAAEHDKYEEDGYSLPEQCKHIFEEYYYHYQSSFTDEEPLLVEYTWERDYLDNTFEGTLDLLLRESNGRVVLRDWKTSKWQPSASWKLMESQLHLYPWGVEEMLEEHGIKVDAVEYDWITGKVPTSPSQNQDGSLSKRKINTTYLSFVRALKEYEIDHRLHADKIKELKAELGTSTSYFDRQRMPLSIPTATRLRDEMVADANYINELFDNPLYATRTVDRSCDWSCDYIELCMGELYGHDVSYLRKKNYQPRVNSKGKVLNA